MISSSIINILLLWETNGESYISQSLAMADVKIASKDWNKSTSFILDHIFDTSGLFFFLSLKAPVPVPCKCMDKSDQYILTNIF